MSAMATKHHKLNTGWWQHTKKVLSEVFLEPISSTYSPQDNLFTLDPQSMYNKLLYRNINASISKHNMFLTIGVKTKKENYVY